MRACIMASSASRTLSAETAPAFSRSSIMVRICRSRAAHPRRNAPAVTVFDIALRESAANAQGARRRNRLLCMADLLDAFYAIGFAPSVLGVVSGEPGPAAHRHSLVILRRIARDHPANGRIRVRAEVPAAGVVHVVRRIGAVLLGCRQNAGSGAGDENESKCGLGEHDCVSCSVVAFALSLTPRPSASASRSPAPGR